MGEVGFYHGLLSGSYEEQANEQGYTLGDKAKMFEEVACSYNKLRLRGYFTEAQEQSICQKITKDLAKNLKPLKNERGADNG